MAKESDELYYIYYRDPAFDVKSERDARQQHEGLDGLDILLYDAGELQTKCRGQEIRVHLTPVKHQSSIEL